MSQVSVIIPTYNRSTYLKGAIETALGQTYDDIEIIVVDDGSEQPYAEQTVSQFDDSVTCLRHENNRGLSAARNTGIRNANGKYIAFLDDDDRWHKRKIAQQVEAIKRMPQAGIVTCLVTAITPEHNIVHCEKNAPSGDCADELLINNNIGTPSRVLVRREALDDVGLFDESLPTKQDWDLYLRLCQSWHVAAVEGHLCFRTIHESMSSSPDALQRDKGAILEKHEDLIRERGLWDQARASVATEIGRSYLDSGDLKPARRHLKESIQIERTNRRLALLLLSLTHSRIVHLAIGFKRTFNQKTSDCTDMEMVEDNILGLD